MRHLLAEAGVRKPEVLRQELAALWLLILMFIAGALNAIGWLRYGQTLSHMTGNISKMGFSMAGLPGDPALMFGGLLLSFFLGAVISGYLFPRLSTQPWSSAGILLMCCGGALAISELLPLYGWMRMAVLALVLGTQNGMTLRYRGLLIRTTHITGHLTDAGAALWPDVSGTRLAGRGAALFPVSQPGDAELLAGGVVGCGPRGEVGTADRGQRKPAGRHGLSADGAGNPASQQVSAKGSHPLKTGTQNKQSPAFAGLSFSQEAGC